MRARVMTRDYRSIPAASLRLRAMGAGPLAHRLSAGAWDRLLIKVWRRGLYSAVRDIIITAATIVLLAAHVAWAQKQLPMKPTAPGAGGDPVWQGIVRASDGRTFITDGGLAIDTALAKPATIPKREFPGRVLDGQLAAAYVAEYRFGDLRVEKPSRTYVSPN